MQLFFYIWKTYFRVLIKTNYLSCMWQNQLRQIEHVEAQKAETSTVELSSGMVDPGFQIMSLSLFHSPSLILLSASLFTLISSSHVANWLVLCSHVRQPQISPKSRSLSTIIPKPGRGLNGRESCLGSGGEEWEIVNDSPTQTSGSQGGVGGVLFSKEKYGKAFWAKYGMYSCHHWSYLTQFAKPNSKEMLVYGSNFHRDHQRT